MSLVILGQGTALPEHSVGPQESMKIAMDYCCQTAEQRRLLPLLYRMSGVKRRFSVLLSGPEGSPNRHEMFPAPVDQADLGPGMGYRMRLYGRESSPLALRASHQALEQSGVSPADITHLITVSCSGFVAPGVDIAIMKGLGLSRTVQRTHVGFMGCHGAINGMRVARAFADSDPSARILLCAVELCSIHYRYGWEPDHIVANALFADGAAAMVAAPHHGSGDTAWCVSATGSCLIPDSEDGMTWRLDDNGFVMSLSARVPALIARHLRGWLENWLGQNGLSLPDIKTWAVHPGGPRILASVVEALGLEKDAVNVSREVLRDYGNMSSPTLLFILDRLRRENAPRPCVGLGFGPGLMAEVLLFT